MQKDREGPGGVASGGSRAPAEKVLDRRADVREDSVGLGRKNPTHSSHQSGSQVRDAFVCLTAPGGAGLYSASENCSMGRAWSQPLGAVRTSAQRDSRGLVHPLLCP